MQPQGRHEESGDVEGRDDAGTPSSVGPCERRQSAQRLSEPLLRQHHGTDAPDGAPMTVLVVDDSMSTRRFLRGVLENSRQFAVVGEASDGRDAIDQARSLQPDLVLLDLVMPNMGGTTALAEMLQVSPHSIVVIVSGSDQAASNQLLEDGIRGSIPKGIRPYELLHQLCVLVGRPFLFDGPGGWDEMERKNRFSPSALPAPDVVRGRAIVYDPDPLVRTLIGRVLNGSGVVVIAETNTQSILLTAVELAKPEFVVLDLSSGGHPDLATVSEIRQRSPQTSIIVYSRSAEWRESVLAAGATAFISKPRIDELATRISHLAPSH
jgi:two-component system chemotaxis response regulator CheY